MSVLVLAASLGSGLTAAADQDQETLAGLSGVRVTVEEPDDDAAGLSESALRREIESRLTAAGVRVLGNREWQAAPGHPSLRLEVTVKREEKGERLFLVELEVEQDVRLLRDSARNLPAATWAAGPRFGVAASGVAPVLRAVREACDEFIAAWRRANPGR